MPVPIFLPGCWHLHSSGLIYHTVTPRVDNEKGRPENVGERSAYARLPTGVRVIGVNSVRMV